MSNTAGYVLLASASIPMLAGWNLSAKGLGKVETATREAKRVAKEAANTVASTQASLAQATGDPAADLANSTSALAEKTADLSSGIDDVSTALKEMTGVFAPARVCFALAFVLVLGALVALDVLTVGSGAT